MTEENQENLRALRLPDADYITKRLSSDDIAGVLSTVELPDERFWLTDAEGSAVYGEVRLSRGVPFEDASLARAALTDKVGDVMVAKSAEWQSAWYHSIYPVEMFDEPRKVRKASKPKVLCFYHSDMDGIASAAIVSQQHQGAEFVPINYGMPFPWDSLVGRESVYMVDFCLQPFSDMERLKSELEGKAAFTWIDHHATAIVAAKEASFECDGLRKNNEAGCELTWIHFHGDEPMPEVVRQAGRFDVWDLKDSSTLPIHYAMEANEEANDPTSQWWSEWLHRDKSAVSELAERGRIIESWLTRFNADRMKGSSFETTLDGLKCIAACTTLPGSMQFDSVKSGYDAAMAFRYSPAGQWTVSMYALKASVDVAEVCAKYGGGGHKGAAGFQCSDLPFSLPSGVSKAELTREQGQPGMMSPSAGAPRRGIRQQIAEMSDQSLQDFIKVLDDRYDTLSREGASKETLSQLMASKMIVVNELKRRGLPLPKWVKKGDIDIDVDCQLDLNTPVVQGQPATSRAVKELTFPEEQSLEVSVRVLKADDELRYVLGVVLEPNDGEDGAQYEPDAHKEIYSADDIRKTAWLYLAKYRGVGDQHQRQFKNNEVVIVESYIAPVDFDIEGEHIRKGSWMLGGYIPDDKEWAKVKRGERNAWSIDGRAKRVPVKP